MLSNRNIDTITWKVFDKQDAFGDLRPERKALEDLKNNYC